MDENNKIPLRVVIPIYTLQLNESEKISLKRCFDLLGGKYPITIAAPEGLDVTEFIRQHPVAQATIRKFPDHYFADLKGYNALMMSEEFYRTFLDSDYILIYQSDCYIFHDDLERWCSLGYDYLGAPWIPKPKYSKWYYRLFAQVRRVVGLPDYSVLDYAVGNGGLSLRRVAKFHEITISDAEMIKNYAEKCSSALFNEDVFWSVQVNRTALRIKTPQWREALEFSFDKLPETCYHLNNRHLPMACHGWSKDQMVGFWREFIR